MSVQVAQETVLNQPKLHLKSSSIEKEAFHRLRNYPGQISQNIHHTLINIPRKVAFLLHQKPAYVAPAVEAFYLRDPIALKPLQTKTPQSNLTFSPQDFVTVSVRFPRAAYAQLKSQDFPTPAAWTGRLPSPADIEASERAKTGMKLTSGMEMLLSDPQNQDKPAVREIKMLLADLDSGDDTLPSDEDIASWPQAQDDEAWLNINFEDLENELGARGTSKDKSESGKGQFGDTQAQENLQRIVAQFEAFLKDDAAGPDGAGLFNEDSDDESDGEEEVESDEDKDEDLVGVDDGKLKAMMQQLGLSMNQSTGMYTSQGANQNPLLDAPTEAGPSRIQELDSDNEDEHLDAADLSSLTAQMEAELRSHGALNLDDPDPGEPAPEKARKGKSKAVVGPDAQARAGTDVEANLAKNLLESLKGQAGRPGPGGNLMGLMGARLPRDEDDGEGGEASRRGGK